VSWVSRTAADVSPSLDGDTASGAAAPLFLNSGDISSPPPSPDQARRDAAGQAVVDALFKVSHRFRDDADNACADLRINARGENYQELYDLAQTWYLRALRVRDCGRLKSIPYRCKNGHRWEVAPMGCGLRLCPFCERRASGHVRRRLAYLLGLFKNPVRMLTLTIRNRREGELESMIRDLPRFFERMRKSPIWRRCVAGAVAVFECTASEERGWHLHIHVAWDGKFMPWEEVLEAWVKATGGQGQRVDLRGSRWPKERAVRYLSKYASKGFRVVDLPEGMVQEFVRSWWGFRTLRTYGTMFGKKPPKEVHDCLEYCPKCGELGEPLRFVPVWKRPPLDPGGGPPT
jgi:hypothetical protein